MEGTRVPMERHYSAPPSGSFQKRGLWAVGVAMSESPTEKSGSAAPAFHQLRHNGNKTPAVLEEDIDGINHK